MIRKTILVAAAGVLIGAPATASAEVPQPVVVGGAQDVAFSTGSGVTDAVLNGLIAAIFGPDDPTKCKFPYCF
ncbi:hypothetical protein ACFXPS_16075 [Nocardia sp. NPDC059091]|uniref:hypothetical protein n=1 Tax=unclassified Nocardia TaxID=2637762 RepID=UPI0036973F87